MAEWLVFALQADADAHAAAVDTMLGYPRAGVNMGRGPHVRASDSRTSTFAPRIKHPTLSLWAYPYEPTVRRAGIPAGATHNPTLDGTWFPQNGVVAFAAEEKL